MNYLERSDAKFLAQAADDSLRLATIQRLSEVRRLVSWMGILLSGCFLLILILGAFRPTLGAAGGAIGIGVAMLSHWMIGMKAESDLRLLKLVEQLRRSGP